MFRPTRQFTRFAARQGSDVFILLYVCSFRHGISFKDPREVPLEILTPGELRQGWSFLPWTRWRRLRLISAFHELVSRKGEANERANEISLGRGTMMVQRGREKKLREWERKSKNEREKERERSLRVRFLVSSRDGGRDLSIREYQQPPFVAHSSTICRALRIRIYRSLRQSNDLKFWANTTPASTTTAARSSFSRCSLASRVLNIKICPNDSLIEFCYFCNALELSTRDKMIQTIIMQ